MKNRPSYEDLQKRISDLEAQLLKNGKVQTHDSTNNIFFKICEYSANGIAIFETNDFGNTFIINYFNKKACEIENVKSENILGQDLKIIFPNIVKSGLVNNLREVYNSGIPKEFPYVMFLSGKLSEWKQNYIYKLSDNLVVVIFLDVTQEKQKDTELKEQKNKLQLAMRSANYYTFQIDLPNNKITTDKELYSSLGYSKPEIEKYSNISGSLIHPDDFEKSSNIITQKQNQKEDNFDNEIRIKNSIGKWIWFSVSGKIIEFYNDHKPKKILGVFKNIQDEREFKIRLQESESRLKLAMESANQALIDWDITEDNIYFSSEWYNMFGYSKVQKIDYNFTIQISHPADVPSAIEKLEAHIKGETPLFTCEVRMKSKSGKWKWILTHGKIVKRDNEGKPIRAIGIQTDITDLKESEERLRESESNFRQLSENINDAFWLRSIDHKLVYANPACKNIIGSNFKDIIENVEIYQDWIHPEDRKFIIHNLQKNLENPSKEHYYEHRVITTDGITKWLWIRSFPVFDENGKLYRRAGIATDITQYKKLISDVINSKEKAEESDLLKSTFLANMSHEIRTPMNGIIGFSELLKDDDITDIEKKEYIKIIDSNGKQLLRLINDIIDISKIEINQLAISKKFCDINPIINDVHNYFLKEQNRIKHTDVKLELHVPNETNNILYTDSSRLLQVLYNLVSNALKFTEHGSVKIGFNKINENNIDFFKFYVTDTGIGIPESMKSIIFERFGQVRPETYRNDHGTGLGLAISKGIVNLLGGKIWFESEINIGSTFYFTIPVRNNTNKKESFESVNSKTMEKWDNLQILIVEDDKDNMEFLRRILEKQGALVHLAKTGEDAVQIATNNDEIQIVLMDIRLPDIDGFEATKRIKQAKPNLPIIAQTAYAMYNDRELCLENGCDDYVSKPLDKTVLYQKINNYIYN